MELVNCKKSKNLSRLCNDARESLLSPVAWTPAFHCQNLAVCVASFVFLIGGILLKFQAALPCVSERETLRRDIFRQQLRQHMDRRCGTVVGFGEITHNRNSRSQKPFLFLFFLHHLAFTASRLVLCPAKRTLCATWPEIYGEETGDLFIPRPFKCIKTWIMSLFVWFWWIFTTFSWH